MMMMMMRAKRRRRLPLPRDRVSRGRGRVPLSHGGRETVPGRKLPQGTATTKETSLFVLNESAPVTLVKCTIPPLGQGPKVTA